MLEFLQDYFFFAILKNLMNGGYRTEGYENIWNNACNNSGTG
jgi:hypothetical protein